MRSAHLAVLLLVGCAAPVAEQAEIAARIPVDLPVDHYRCATVSDCAIAGDACYSCAGLTIINRKHLADFSARYGDRPGDCVSCDNSRVELVCEHGICREAGMDIHSKFYRTCSQALDCAVGLDPCGQPVAVNRHRLSQYRALSHVTPRRCSRMPQRTPVSVACEAGECAVGYEPAAAAAGRTLGRHEITALDQWIPYIRHGRTPPPQDSQPAQQQPHIGVAKPAGSGP